MTMSTAWRALVVGAFLGTIASDGTAQDLPEMPSFEEVLSLQNVRGAAISPDGTRVAYVVRQADFDENRFDSEIWIDDVCLTRGNSGKIDADGDGSANDCDIDEDNDGVPDSKDDLRVSNNVLRCAP